MEFMDIFENEMETTSTIVTTWLIFLFFLQFNVYEPLLSTMCLSTLLRPDHNCTSSRRDSIIVINERGSFLLYYTDKLWAKRNILLCVSSAIKD